MSILVIVSLLIDVEVSNWNTTMMHREAPESKQNVSIGLIEIFYWRVKQIPL
jgi:hypothetical protein